LVEKILNKIAPLIALAAILMMPIVSAYASTPTNSPGVTGQVSIVPVPTCTLSIGTAALPGTPVSSLTYATGYSGQTVAGTPDLFIQNTGNTAFSLPVIDTASDWISGSTIEINAQQTQFSTTAPTGPWIPLASTSGSPALGNTPVVPTLLAPSAHQDTWWQLNILLNVPGFTGSASQSMTFASGC
jgi:hypothetical protein